MQQSARLKSSKLILAKSLKSWCIFNWLHRVCVCLFMNLFMAARVREFSILVNFWEPLCVLYLKNYFSNFIFSSNSKLLKVSVFKVWNFEIFRVRFMNWIRLVLGFKILDWVWLGIIRGIISLDGGTSRYNPLKKFQFWRFSKISRSSCLLWPRLDD